MATPILSEAASALLVSGPSISQEFTSSPDALALNAEAAANLHNPQWLYEQAALLAESLNYIISIPNMFDQVITTLSVGEFENVTFDEFEGMQAFWTHRGGYVDETEVKGDAFTMPRDSLGVHVKEFEGKLRANFAQSLQTLMRYAPVVMRNEIYRRLMSMIVAAIPSGNANYVDATATGLTAPVLTAAIRNVADAPVPNGAVGGSTITIVGRKSALAAIPDFAGWSEKTKEQIEKTGMVGVYKGANIVELPNIQTKSGVPAFDAKDVYVLSRNAGYLVNYGGTRAKQWAENPLDYVHSLVRKEVGLSLRGLDRGYVKRIRIAS